MPLMIALGSITRRQWQSARLLATVLCCLLAMAQRASAEAPETEVALSASVGGQAVRDVVEIASRQRYAALLRQRGLTGLGESTEAAVALLASGSIGARSTVAEDAARTRKLAAAAITGGLALLCGVVALVVARRHRRRRSARRPERAPRAHSSPAPPCREAPTVCPTCQQEYPPGVVFCPADGNRLVPLQETAGPRPPTGGICPVCGQGFDPGIHTCPQHNEELIPAALYKGRNGVEQRPTKKICPVCGGQFDGDARFCGADGATLVPVN